MQCALEHPCIRHATVQAWALEYTQFHLGHIEPIAVLERVVELRLLRKVSRLGRRKGCIKRCGRMRIEVVQHHDERGTYVLDVSLPFEPRLERAFLRTRRTVARLICSALVISASFQLSAAVSKTRARMCLCAAVWPCRITCSSWARSAPLSFPQYFFLGIAGQSSLGRFDQTVSQSKLIPPHQRDERLACLTGLC